MNLPLKVDIPNSVTCLTRTPIFRWYVVRCGPKNVYQKIIMCLKELGLQAQNMVTILSSIVNIIGGSIDNSTI